MKKSDLIGILYVSISIVIWGTIGSLIDYGLLQKKIYIAGSFGQLITFFITGGLVTISSIQIFKKIYGSANSQ